MFQFGDAIDDSMFNMTMFTDTLNFITTNYAMRNFWPHKARYTHRWHTVILYRNSFETGWFLCWVFNTYGYDRLGIMKMDLAITRDDWQTIRWVACDSPKDSCPDGPASSISSYFGAAAVIIDGFCTKPDYWGSNPTISVTNEQDARGIRYLRHAQTIKEFLCADGATNGLTGAVTLFTCLVTNGDASLIRIAGGAAAGEDKDQDVWDRVHGEDVVGYQIDEGDVE